MAKSKKKDNKDPKQKLKKFSPGKFREWLAKLPPGTHVGNPQKHVLFAYIKDNDIDPRSADRYLPWIIKFRDQARSQKNWITAGRVLKILDELNPPKKAQKANKAKRSPERAQDVSPEAKPEANAVEQATQALHDRAADHTSQFGAQIKRLDELTDKQLEALIPTLKMDVEHIRSLIFKLIATRAAAKR